MPNYSLVANSTFQPFTYQELMLSVERQNQYFERLAEEYDKMSSQADVLEAMGSSDLDRGSNTYNRYKAYSDNLRKERDNLFANGLNYESRQRLSDLRRAYNTEIVPIQNAWQKREQEAQLQMKARMDAAARGIDIRFSRDAANSSLDSYLQNPNQGFQVINGQQITNEVANQFRGLASQVQSDGKGNYFLKGKPLNQVEYSIITQKGMDWNHYQDFINNPNDPRWSNLKGIIDSTLNAHGIRNFDENTYNDMFRYGAQGVAAGVGARDVQFHTDRAGVMALEDAYAQRREARQYNRAVALEREKAKINGTQNPAGNNVINPLPLRSQQEISENNKDIQDFIRKGFVEQDPVTGQYRVTSKGFKEYRTMSANNEKRLALAAAGESSNAQAIEAAKKMPNTVPSKFRKFMDGLNGGKSITDNKGNVLPGWGPNRAGNLFASGIVKNQEGSYDTYHSTEYDRQLASSYGNEFTKQLWSAARLSNGKKVLDVVDYNGKDGWKKGKALSSSDLDGYKVTNVRYSKYGNTAILQKDGEDPIRVRIPKGVNLGAEHNVQSAIADADDYGLILGRGKRPMVLNGEIVRNAKGEIMFTNENLTPEDRAVFDKYQRDALNEMSSYGSQFVVPSVTKNDEYNPFAF